MTREAASELLETIPSDRIEKIENERVIAHPDEILIMAEKYKTPRLANYYCANQCPIGQKYVPEIKVKDLSQIVLEMLASLNSSNSKKERLIEITVDGKISEDEIADFIKIQEASSSSLYINKYLGILELLYISVRTCCCAYG